MYEILLRFSKSIEAFLITDLSETLVKRNTEICGI
jgi:hypothetical protein